REQRVEILKRAKQRMNVAVIRYVISKIHHRRWINRRQPDRINAKPGKIIQPGDHPLEISQAIAIAVGERSRIDLEDEPFLRPLVMLVLFRHTTTPSNGRRASAQQAVAKPDAYTADTEGAVALDF